MSPKPVTTNVSARVRENYATLSKRFNMEVGVIYDEHEERLAGEELEALDKERANNKKKGY